MASGIHRGSARDRTANDRLELVAGAIIHNLEVIKTADWIIDLGPEGGGGEVVAVGTPEQVAAHPVSHTGRFLAAVVGR